MELDFQFSFNNVYVIYLKINYLSLLYVRMFCCCWSLQSIISSSSIPDLQNRKWCPCLQVSIQIFKHSFTFCFLNFSLLIALCRIFIEHSNFFINLYSARLHFTKRDKGLIKKWLIIINYFSLELFWMFYNILIPCFPFSRYAD